MKPSGNFALAEKIHEILNLKKDNGTFIIGHRLKDKMDIAYDNLCPFMLLHEKFVRENKEAEFVELSRGLSIKLRSLIDNKDKKKSTSSYETWKSKILASNSGTTTIDELSEIIRPYSEDDFQFKKSKIFTQEEINYLELSSISITNISTFKKYLLWANETEHFEDILKTFQLLIFIMAVYQISVSGIPGDHDIVIKHNPKLESYYGFYDRSFVKHNDYGICELTIFNDYWSRIIYYYPKDVYRDSAELYVFAHVEYFTEKGIVIIKNFEDFTGIKGEVYKNGPVENFIIMKSQGTAEPKSLNNMMLGYTTSFNRKKDFPIAQP
ncbi:hypothetical protein [Dyadobacter diqingensis]|uniref:hypothetical protein n=1 Tax=Dyadobacter diqingensis TaxID=2938121 RepID=UPI0020C1ACE8|nr:hypothetical protein [Dyadobacter diqingensis]